MPTVSLARERSSTSTPPAHPVRTCVGCRKRVNKTNLVRIVVSGSELAVDESFTAPGRGAYVHPGQECLAAAIRRRALTRALKVRQSVNEEALRAQFARVIVSEQFGSSGMSAR
ncbi:MAG: YlxR family protein [Actinobacteria bacterium]|nr:YlxR family protein [Actinomycetota bacterium]